MKFAIPLACALVAFAAPVLAQQNPTPGLPAYTLNAPVAPPPAAAQPIPATPAPPVPIPTAAPAPVSDPEKAAALLKMVESATSPPPAKRVDPPPHDITIRTGSDGRFAIGKGTLNRLLTPFADPVIKVGDNASVQRQGPVVFVTTGSAEPVAMFISPRGEPERVIALTMTPADGVGPVDVRLHLDGYEAPPAAAAPDVAAALEASQPYVDTLKDIFRELALGRIPQGYGFTDVKAGRTAWMPSCYMPGISITPRQILEGGALVTVVARAVNTSIDTLEVDEGGCSAPGVLAVAAWPNVRLSPGQETELYVAVRRPDPMSVGDRRPSALVRGGH